MGIVNFTEMSAQKICALGRALYGLYPLTCAWNNVPIKLYDISLSPISLDNIVIKKDLVRPGFVFYDKNAEQLCVLCADSKYVSFKRIGILGKKPMTAKDFNNGYLKKEVILQRLFQ